MLIIPQEHDLKLTKTIIWKTIKLMIIRAVIEWDEFAQAYSATCPELNFVSSCGETKENAIANLKDAITLMLEPIPEDMYSNDSTFEQVEMT